MWVGITYSVQQIAAFWMVRGPNLDGVRYSAPVQTVLGTHPTYYAMGTESFPGLQRTERGVDDPPQLEPRLKKE
jgi:hypothetical protein